LVYLNGVLLAEGQDYDVDPATMILRITGMDVYAHDNVKIITSRADDGWTPQVGDYVWFRAFSSEERPAQITGYPTEFSSSDWVIECLDAKGGELYVKTDYLRLMNHLEALALQATDD
jgi:hypothetical protein